MLEAFSIEGHKLAERRSAQMHRLFQHRIKDRA